METCYYCGNSYHPMPVYTRQMGENMDMPQQIYVCHYAVDQYGDIANTNCCKLAEADGYKHNPKLSPKR